MKTQYSAFSTVKLIHYLLTNYLQTGGLVTNDPLQTSVLILVGDSLNKHLFEIWSMSKLQKSAAEEDHRGLADDSTAPDTESPWDLTPRPSASLITEAAPRGPSIISAG